MEAALPAKNIELNKLLASKKYLDRKEYWLQKLNRELTQTSLCADYPETVSGEGEWAKFNFTLEEKTITALNAITQKNPLLAYLVLASALALVLNKYTGNPEIILGSPILKDSPELDLNQFVPLCLSIDENVNFKELLGLSKRILVEAYNQNYPMQKIAEELGLENFFTITCLLENVHSLEHALLSKSALTFAFQAEGATITAAIHYRKNLYRRQTIEGLSQHYYLLLEKSLANMNIPLKDLTILTGDERERILAEFNQPRKDFPRQDLVQMFERQVELTPDKVAVTVKTESLTYRELNCQANQLAHFLQAKGVQKETIVAIMAEQTISLAPTILGILKSGGAYLPLDPEYPVQRIQFMLQDSGCKILLTESHLPGVENFSGETVYLTPEIFTGDATNVKPVCPNDLAYVIYTSGSTGNPKGVMIEHQGIANYVNWRLTAYGFTSNDVTLQLVSFSFDGFAANFYPPLVSGGRLVLPGTNQVKDFSEMVKLIRGEKVTNFSIVPAVYQAVLENATADDVKTLRFVCLAGERPASELISLSQSLNPQNLLVSEYGATEDSVCSTAYFGLKAEDGGKVGKPIANHQVYILDDMNTLRPIGLPGEICVAGVGVARGYLNHPELTEARFSANPFGAGQIYHTGDLAKWLADGSIELIGRKDNQVKIRGYRVELGEVEERLQRHPAIKNAVVLCKKDNQGLNYLTAYLVLTTEISSSELKASLAAELPHYLIPAHMLVLKQLPLTPNGKIDRKALAELVEEVGGEIAQPTNIHEERLWKIWVDLLEREDFGIHENFFALGGHSLKATQLASKIYKEMQVEIPVNAIYENTTIYTLAQYLTSLDLSPQNIDENIVLLKSGSPTAKNLFIIHNGSGEVESYLPFINNLQADFTCWGIKKNRQPTLGPQNFTIESLAQEYTRKIRTIQPKGPYYIMGWCMGGTIAFEIVKELEKSEEIQFFAMISSPGPKGELWGNLTEFTCHSELAWLKEYLPAEFNPDPGTWTTPDELWEVIFAEFVHSNLDLDILVQLIPDDLMKTIPFALTDKRTVIYYFNVIRSLIAARAKYVPDGVIKAPIFFISAAETDVTPERWQPYSVEKLQIYTITGDHFSIFQEPDVVNLAGQFDKLLTHGILMREEERR